MKKIIYFILIGTFSCQMEKKTEVEPPVSSTEKKPWTTYEGRVPLNDKNHLYMEVSMLAADQLGEGSYRINEFIEAHYNFTAVSTFKGKYSTLHGDDGQEILVQFHNSALENPLKRTYLTRGFKDNLTDTNIKMIQEEAFRISDLTLKIKGKNTLLVLDENMKPLSLDPLYNLTKRTSKLFTPEGYFRHKGDTADFLEMNTIFPRPDRRIQPSS